MRVEHYVKYLYPGLLFSEEESVKINTRTVEDAIKRLPAGAFAFLLYDVEVRTGILEDGGEITDRKVVNESGKYYPDAIVLSLAEISTLMPGSILESNMQCNGYSRVVKTRRGNYQPFEDADAVVSLEGITGVSAQ